MSETAITLDKIWTDFFEVIRKEAGHGTIVEIKQTQHSKIYTCHEKKINKPQKVRILLTHTPAMRGTIDDTIAGRIFNGVANKRNGTDSAIHDILYYFGAGGQTCLEEESAHIESIIRKTFAVKIMRTSCYLCKEKLSDHDFENISVSEQDYASLCKKLLEIIHTCYLNEFADDKRYAWLLKSHKFNEWKKVPQYLTALICAALISICTEQASTDTEMERDRNREAIRSNMDTFLFDGKNDSPSEAVLYYETLWKSFYRGIVRDQKATGKIRELIDFYVVPEITDAEGVQVKHPLADLSSSVYVTAGSGFGKTTLLQIILLSSIIDALISEHSNVISANSSSKIKDYQAIRYTLFGEIPHSFFPVFIHASKASNASYDSVLELAEAHTVSHFQDLIKTAHNAGQLLLLVDSLDEVESGSKLDCFMNKLQELLQDYPLAKVILTSRFLGRTQLPFEAKTVHLSALGDEAIQKITQALLSHRTASELQETLTKLKNNTHLSALATNPFMLLTMLEDKKGRYLHQVLQSIVNAIIERRWDSITKEIMVEHIKMLLGHLACCFVFGNINSVSRRDIEKSFYKAKEMLKEYQIEIDVPDENIEHFLRVLSCQSGILNITYQNHVENYVFQDNLVMCWLAAHYVSRILTDAIDVGIKDLNNESSLWSNAQWLNTFIRSFEHRNDVFSLDAVYTLILSLVTCSERSGDVLQMSILYYLLFRDAVSLSATEKGNIADGYKAIIENTFGENDIANHPRSNGRRLIDTALMSHHS